jgi:hypothetical protein
MRSQPVDFLLLKAGIKEPNNHHIETIVKTLKDLNPTQYKNINITITPELSVLYAYFHFHQAQLIYGIAIDAFLNHLPDLDHPQVTRMQTMGRLPGASHLESPSIRYVVEMDFAQDWMERIIGWYEGEHLQMLADVPGCVAATRCINLDQSPQSFAYYDLTSNDVRNTRAWLNVRGTAWSDRVRPYFQNVQRTHFHFA